MHCTFCRHTHTHTLTHSGGALLCTYVRLGYACCLVLVCMYVDTIAYIPLSSLLQYPESSTSVPDLLSYLQPLVKVSMKLVHKEVVKMKVCPGRAKGSLGWNVVNFHLWNLINEGT